MTSDRVALDIAAFLDSEHVPSPVGVPPDELRSALERLLDACYEELGIAPHLLDGAAAEALLTEHLPRRFGRREPVLAHIVPLAHAYFEHLAEVELVAHAFEIHAALDEHAARFLEEATNPRGEVVAGPGRTIRHRGRKLGRNDPCWCGSGRKFKTCHGRRG